MDMDHEMVPAPAPSPGPQPYKPPPSPPQRRNSLPPGSSPLPRHKVAYVYTTHTAGHFCLDGHPEKPERTVRIWEKIEKAGLHHMMTRIPVRPARRNELLLVHTETHCDKVESIRRLTLEDIEEVKHYYEHASLYVNLGTVDASLLSCGGVIEACLRVAEGQYQKSFAILRPPGHHAEPDAHMGFCFYNNAAIAAKVVQQRTKIKRILILDWDVHHGNGTQHAFNDDPSVLYISIHRYDNGTFYPCGTFGALNSCGEGAGLGYSVNIPWPEKPEGEEGYGDADYVHAFLKIVMPIAMEFAPELVIISAGFDAADGDPLGDCHVTPVGYAHMTHMLSGLAGGKMVVVLEGGYGLDETANSALAVTKVLLGESPPELPVMRASEEGSETVWLVALEQSKYWKSVNPKALEPKGPDNEPIRFSIPEILKAHRSHYLYTKHSMMQMPLINQESEEAFGTQVMCTADLMENDTLVILVHEFGNLRIELQSALTCNVNMEHSYLLDMTKELMTWVRSEGFALLDINLFPKPFANIESSYELSIDTLSRGILTYLWDNYIQLSKVQRIILIGHGPGCDPIINLLSERESRATDYIKGVVQIISDTADFPRFPKDNVLRKWYRDISYVTVPSMHPVLNAEWQKKNYRWHGVVAPVEIAENRAATLVVKALPEIQAFVRAQLQRFPTSDVSEMMLTSE